MPEQETTGQKWKFRSARPKDLNFILATFFDAVKENSLVGKDVSKSVFKAGYCAVIDKILGESQTTVACLPDDDDTLLGYIVHTNEILHFCFVKKSFWGLGIAKSLFMNAFENLDDPPFIICSHKTYMTKEIFRNHPQLEFDPFVLYQTHKEH